MNKILIFTIITVLLISTGCSNQHRMSIYRKIIYLGSKFDTDNGKLVDMFKETELDNKWDMSAHPTHSQQDAKYAVTMSLLINKYDAYMVNGVTPQGMWNSISLDGLQSADEIAAELQSWGLDASVITLKPDTVLQTGDIIRGKRYWQTIVSRYAGYDADDGTYIGKIYNPSNGYYLFGALPAWVDVEAIIIR